MGIHSEPKLYRKLVEFLKLLNIYLNHFPRHEKYALATDSLPYMLRLLSGSPHPIILPKSYKKLQQEVAS